MLDRAHHDDKAAVYRQLNLKLIYKPEDAVVSAKLDIEPHHVGLWVVSEGGLAR